MLPPEAERLWRDYVEAERIRIRPEYLSSLNHFIEALLPLPTAVWHPWARQLAQRIVEEDGEPPVRMPLFYSVIFPALRAGIESSSPGSARWLAGLAQHLYKSPQCAEQLPENLRHESGLLKQAIKDDPNDLRAKTQLLDLMRDRFEYVLHELPAGVLYGQNGATREQCIDLLVELADYIELAREIGETEEDRELISSARFHITAYRQYLSELGRHQNYEAFLATCE